MSEDEKIIDNFKYWFETNTENGVSAIPDFICKKLLDLCQQEKEKNKELEKQLEEKEKEKNKEIDLRYVPYEQYVSTLNEANEKWKDKIKAKIKELENINNNIKPYEDTGDLISINNGVILHLKDLLKEK